jgi:hypothetical protein
MDVPLSCWDGNSTKPWPQRTARVLAHELVSRLGHTASNSPSYAYGSSCHVGLVRARNHRLRLAACRRSDSIVYPNVVRRRLIGFMAEDEVLVRWFETADAAR